MDMSREDVRLVCLVSALGFTAVQTWYMIESGGSWNGRTCVDFKESEEIVEVSVGVGEGEERSVGDREEGGLSGLAWASSSLSWVCWQLWDLVLVVRGRDFAVSHVSSR